ncbi:MAG: NAD-dependent epimerase/dehydratase family protein [Candidatus Thermoplasmatota archaeon]|nr:NAD-dependent epimerase/dehydratase family protein [Candidatus Thermoplasmatota archaeon]MDA8142350.1 NAD-dependent epimerase/dehydratase family protein [Thermoplasmatales archaeon]
MVKILITGSLGQIGSELVTILAKRFGKSSILMTDVKEPAVKNSEDVEFSILDVTNADSVRSIVRENGITDIFHLASILSAAGEKNPQKAFAVNSTGTFNVIDAASSLGINRLIIPSTIGVFGPETPRDNVPDITITRPTTMYGITKVSAELLSSYYHDRFGLDVRGVRYPGIISYLTPPSAGTTDYAVDMFYHAVKHQEYTCYLSPETTLPMMYMPDALKSLLRLFDAPASSLKHRLEYNISSFSFNPQELYGEIKRHILDFRVRYEPDFREEIAKNWPRTLDTSEAAKDWGFSPEYSFKETVSDMIVNVRKILDLA